MTTIAFRDGILAADSRETDESITLNNTCKKVFKLKDGSLFGGAGKAEDVSRLESALKKGFSLPTLDEVSGLLIDTKGRIWLYEGNIWQRVKSKYYAIGSGNAFALAAMDAGATAIEAVRIGIKRDPYSGGRVSSVKLSSKRSK